jgi:hypothetical protein
MVPQITWFNQSPLIFSGQRALNRRLCYDILVTAHLKTEGFGMEEGGEVVYDNRTTMYTSTPINLPKVGLFHA